MTFSGMKEQAYDENCNQDEDSYDQNNGLRVYVNKVMIPMGVHFTMGRLISETLSAQNPLVSRGGTPYICSHCVCSSGGSCNDHT